MFQAVDLRAGEVEIVPAPPINQLAEEDPLLKCPHCCKHIRLLADGWISEGHYTIPGPDGFTFTVMTCPECGGIAPLIEYVMVPADDPRLLEDSAETATGRNRNENSVPARKNAKVIIF